MKNVASKTDAYSQPAMEYGVVVYEKDKLFAVRSDSGTFTAKAAAGCLIKPEEGDLVLFVSDGDLPGYILSVLEKTAESARPTTMQFDGPVVMKIKDGGLNVNADEDIAFTAPVGIALASKRLGIAALEGDMKIESLSFTGKFLKSQVEKMKILADSVDSIFRRAVARLTTSYRYVEEHEEIQSASTRMIVDGTMTMQTKNTMHIAEGHIKMDAQQIHLG